MASVSQATRKWGRDTDLVVTNSNWQRLFEEIRKKVSHASQYPANLSGG